MRKHLSISCFFSLVTYVVNMFDPLLTTKRFPWVYTYKSVNEIFLKPYLKLER